MSVCKFARVDGLECDFEKMGSVKFVKAAEMGVPTQMIVQGLMGTGCVLLGSNSDSLFVTGFFG